MVMLLDGRTELDPVLYELRRDGSVVPLEPQAFDVLRHLVEHRDRVVSKEELMDVVWHDRFVSETSVTSRIKQVRRALGDDGQSQRVIRTVHRRGYRFVADVLDAGGRRPVRYTVSDGLHIAYQVSGSGPRDIVLIPGFISHLDLDWEDARHAHFLDRLGTLGRLVRFDKRGTGMSDRPSGVPDLETRVHDVLAVMDAVGSERAVVCGYSEGGPMAALLAALHPDRVSALVLYGAYARRTRTADNPWAPTEEQWRSSMTHLLASWDWRADLLRRCPSGDAAMQDWWDRRMRAAATPGTVRALMDMNALVDVRPVLGSVRAPTLVLHRVDDALVPARDAEYLAASIPGARLRLLPGVDHLVCADPDQLLDEVEDFLATVPAARHEHGLVVVAAVSGPDASRVVQDLTAAGGRAATSGTGAPVALFDAPARAARAARRSLRTASDCAVGLTLDDLPSGADGLTGPGIDRAQRLAADAPRGGVAVCDAVAALLAGTDVVVQTRRAGEGRVVGS